MEIRIVLKSWKIFLEGKGINVYLAYNCKDAIIKIFSKKFDLIFLEIILVDGDGWDFFVKKLEV